MVKYFELSCLQPVLICLQKVQLQIMHDFEQLLQVQEFEQLLQVQEFEQQHEVDKWWVQVQQHEFDHLQVQKAEKWQVQKAENKLVQVFAEMYVQ